MTTPSSDDRPQSQDATPLAKALFGWTESKAAQLGVFIGLGVLSVALIAADLLAPGLFEKYRKFPISEAIGFYGFYGFAAFAFVVLMGWPLGKLLTRPEDYYGEADPEPDPTDDGEGGDV